MSGIASVQESTASAGAKTQDSAIVPAQLQTRAEANAALVANAEGMSGKAQPAKVETSIDDKAKELQEMSAAIPREYCDDKGMPKKAGGWEVLFAKLFMITHPGMKLREIFNGGRPFIKPSTSEQIMYNKHKYVLQLDAYHKKKEKYFPEPEMEKPKKGAQVPEAVPVAA